MKKWLLTLICLFSLCSTAWGACTIIKAADYESSGDYPQWYGFDTCLSGACTNTDDWMLVGVDTGVISTAFARTGTSSLKLDLSYSQVVGIPDQSSHRSMYRWVDGTGGAAGNYPLLQLTTGYWAAFSFYLPSDWVVDQRYGLLVWETAENWDTCDTVKQNAVAITLETDGRVKFRVKGDHNACTTTANPPTNIFYDLGPVTPGAWHDIVMYVSELTYNPTATVQAWFNGSQIVNATNVRTGFNNTCTSCGWHYISEGLYTWSWKNNYYPPPAEPTPNRIILYLDSQKLGSADCTYNDMAPDALPALTGTITTPTADPTYTTHSATVTLEGTVTGATSVNYTNNRGGSGACSLAAGAWTCPAAGSIALLNGINNIVVNFAGAEETNQDEIAVTYSESKGDTDTITTTGGLIYLDWTGTDNAQVYVTGSVLAQSAACNEFYAHMDATVSDVAEQDKYVWDVALGGVGSGGNLGDATVYTSGINIQPDVVRVQRYVAPCTGTLGYPEIYHANVSLDNVKVCAYLNTDNDAVPDDDKLACSGAISSGGAVGWKTDGVAIGGAINQGDQYWVAAIGGPDTWYGAQRTAGGGTSVDGKLFTRSWPGSYAAEPENLTQTWSEFTDRGSSAYIGVICGAGYSADTISNRGAGGSATSPSFDPKYWTLSQGEHVFSLVKKESCVEVESITFNEYTPPTPPVTLGVGFQVGYSAGGQSVDYSSSGYEVAP